MNKCQLCKGNNGDTPCAYPEAMKRLKVIELQERCHDLANQVMVRDAGMVELQREVDELRAHVEALLVAANIFYDTGMADALYGVFSQRPAQSLHAIKAEVEEETSKKYLEIVKFSKAKDILGLYAEMLDAPRKYKGE